VYEHRRPDKAQVRVRVRLRGRIRLTGAQSSAVVETVDLGSGRVDGVAAGQGRRVMIEKPVHLIGIITVVIHVFRHIGFD